MNINNKIAINNLKLQKIKEIYFHLLNNFHKSEIKLH